MRRLMLRYFFIVSLFPVYNLQAQTSLIDSLKRVVRESKNVTSQVYCDLAFELLIVNPDSSIVLVRQGIALAQKSKDYRALSCNYNVLGLAYQKKGLFQESINACDTAATFGKQSGDSLDVARAYSNIAGTYLFLRNYSEALKYEMQAIGRFEAANDARKMANSYQHLSIIYRQTNQFDKAIEYIRKAILNFEKAGRRESVANCISSYANILFRKQEFDSSITKHLEAIKIYDEVGSITGKATSYDNIGFNYYKMGAYQPSLTNYAIAKNLYEQVGSEVDVATVLSQTGSIKSKLGQHADALSDLHRAIAILERNKVDSYKSDAYEDLSEAYENAGDMEKALEYYKKFAVLTDSLEEVDRQSEILRLQTEFETVKKDQQIELLNKESIIHQKEISNRKTMNYVLIGGLLVSLAFFYFFWNRFQLRQRLKEVRIRNKIASDLHDDVGSTLSSIRMLSGLAQKKLPVDIQRSEALLEKITEYSVRMTDNMRDIVWSVNPENDSIESLLQRLRTFAGEVLEPNNITLDLKIDSEIKRIRLPLLYRRDLYLICKEALNNIAKYSKAQRVDIHFYIENRRMSLKIMDNGVGFDEASILPGNGLKNMKDRARSMNADLLILSENGMGTEILLKMKV